MIDEIGGKRGRGIQMGIRQRAHDVRRVRNYWAHESDAGPRADDRRRGPRPTPGLPSRAARRVGLIASLRQAD